MRNFLVKKIGYRGALAAVMITLLTQSAATGGWILRTAEAAALTSIKDTLSASAPSTVSNHTIQFVTPSGVDAAEAITITFPVGFSMGSVAFGDVDFAEGDSGTCSTASFTDKTLAGSASGATWGAAVSGQVLTITSDSGTVTAGRCVTVEIGTNATAGTAGTNRITNPAKSAGAGTADPYDITIAGSFGDTGTAMVAIVEGVTISATIDESLSFSIAAVTNNNCDSSFTTLAGPDSTVSAVSFGTLTSANTFVHGCHDLSVTTNATNGYAVTAEENTNLIKADNTVLADTIGDNGTMTESTQTAWGTATNNGFGYSCANNSGTGCSVSATTNYRQFACKGTDGQCDPGTGAETQQAVMASASPANANSSRIEYKLSYGATQASGVYSNTITYIATPTF